MSTLPTAMVRTRLDALGVAGLDVPACIPEMLDLLLSAVPFSCACVVSTDPATQLVTRALKWGTMIGVTAGEADAAAPAGPVVGADGQLLSADAAAQQRRRWVVASWAASPSRWCGSPSSRWRAATARVKKIARRGCGSEAATGGGISVTAAVLPGGGASSAVAVTIEDASAPDVLPLVVASFGLTAREQDDANSPPVCSPSSTPPVSPGSSRWALRPDSRRLRGRQSFRLATAS